MSERRLMTDPVSARERELLRSWEGERAPALVRERAVRRAAALAGAATLSAVGASGLTKVAGAAGKGSAWALASLLKGLAVLALAGAATYGVLHTRGTLAPGAPPAPTVVARPSSPVVVLAPRPSSEPPLAAPEPRPFSESPHHAAPVAPAPRRSSVPAVPALAQVASSSAAPQSEAPPHAPRAPAPRLGDELARIAGVRSALAAGDPSLALARLDELQALFPKSPLGPEAEILRMDALYAKGDREGARARARTILQRTPPSPYADRARRLLETSP